METAKQKAIREAYEKELDNISELDFNAIVAKEIYEYGYIHVGKDYDGENECDILFPKGVQATQDDYNMLPRMGKPHESFFVPQFSTNINYAIMLAKRVGYNKSITLYDLPLKPFDIAKEAYLHWRKKIQSWKN